MPHYSDESPSHANSDAKARRKVLDQRRMAYRRAIESYAEQRQLQHDLTDYPDLLVASARGAEQAQQRRVA